jgi:2-polyprenyl-6-methoxyphenol hydroxylase-like FAD-dependent oxidoreductase
MSASELRSGSVGIVGGGPVGMMLALLLERHGVPSVLFNVEETSRWHPKGSTHNARTMEHYRRLGLSVAVRQVGLPWDHPTDVAYFTRLNSWELGRIKLPSEAERMATVAASPKLDQVPEPIHRANQMYVEKLLFDRVGESPFITRRYGWRVATMQQDADGVGIAAERVADGAREEWRFAYLVGCDGGQSVVRRALGIRYSGFDTLEQEFMGGRMIATYLRMPTLLPDVIGQSRLAWQYTVINPGRRLVLVSLDGKAEFLLFTRAPDPNVAPDDAAIRRQVQGAVGLPLPVEVLGHNPWTAGVALVAERFGAARVVLAGDAVHLFTPTGGFGMNTGLDDAANLAWKFAALVQGWGGPKLLETYEPERRPIAIRNTTAARALAITLGEMPVTPDIEADTPSGTAARQILGAFLSSTLGEEFASLGVQLGARYDGSPIIVGDGTPPIDDPIVYRPSSVPGGRAPHVWMGSGRGIGDSLYDRLGLGFTLLCLGIDAGAGALKAAAARSGVPLAVLRIGDADARQLYERDFALIRPDQHIAWRGNALPEDCDRLLARVTGFL